MDLSTPSDATKKDTSSTVSGVNTDQQTCKETSKGDVPTVQESGNSVPSQNRDAGDDCTGTGEVSLTLPSGDSSAKEQTTSPSTNTVSSVDISKIPTMASECKAACASVLPVKGTPEAEGNKVLSQASPRVDSITTASEVPAATSVKDSSEIPITKQTTGSVTNIKVASITAPETDRSDTLVTETDSNRITSAVRVTDQPRAPVTEPVTDTIKAPDTALLTDGTKSPIKKPAADTQITPSTVPVKGNDVASTTEPIADSQKATTLVSTSKEASTTSSVIDPTKGPVTEPNEDNVDMADDSRATSKHEPTTEPSGDSIEMTDEPARHSVSTTEPAVSSDQKTTGLATDSNQKSITESTVGSKKAKDDSGSKQTTIPEATSDSDAVTKTTPATEPGKMSTTDPVTNTPETPIEEAMVDSQASVKESKDTQPLHAPKLTPSSALDSEPVPMEVTKPVSVPTSDTDTITKTAPPEAVSVNESPSPRIPVNGKSSDSDKVREDTQAAAIDKDSKISSKITDVSTLKVLPDSAAETSVTAEAPSGKDSLNAGEEVKAKPMEQSVNVPNEEKLNASSTKESPKEISKEAVIEAADSAVDTKKKEGLKSPEEVVVKAKGGELGSTVAKSVAPTGMDSSLLSKLPSDAPPSMDDDSVSMDTYVEKEGSKVRAEEPMDTGLIMETPGSGCASEESSKDVPPQDFKPFSHYTEDGKLIGKDEERQEEKAPVISADTNSVSASGQCDLVSTDDSFPSAPSEMGKSQPGVPPASVSQFQGQFMDFLKCNDNATQHSFKGTEGNENASPKLSESEQGEAKMGSEVTAEGGITTESEVAGQEASSEATTPKSGKRRRRRTKAQMIADRAAAAAAASAAATAAGTEDASNTSQTESTKGGRQLRKRKAKEDDDKNGEDVIKDGEKDDSSPKGEVKKEGALLTTTFPAEKLFEYQWPQEKNADWFFLQEHLSAFLGVKSFKRKYPDLERRPVGMPERNFLQESGVVSEMQCDLGLTSLKSDQVYELLLKDFPEKYQQYAEVLHEREQVRIKEKNKAASDMAKMDKSNILDAVQRAVRSAAEFNAQFTRERREERKAYFDLQTSEIHYPKSSLKVLPPEATKASVYPVALIPGQFQEYYKKYTPQQMKYFPLNTVMYDPPRHLKTIYADPADKYESELDSQSASSRPVDVVGNNTAAIFSDFQMLHMQGDNEDGSSSSGSSSGSGSDGDSESSSDAEEPEVPPPAPPSNKKAHAPRTPRGKKVPAKDATVMCNICQGSSERNKIGEAEELVKCSECGRHGHPSCLELTEEMIPNIKTYPWQCMECKTCVECMDPYDEDKMMFCDHCDRGYHTFCVGLRSIPTGRWECPSCRPDPPAKKRKRQQNAV